jgi:hypothetical protein
MNRFLPFLSAGVIVCLALAGCESTGKTTLLGAGTGAAIAAATGHSALRGAAIGAASGFVVGKIVKHERERAYEEAYYDTEYRGRYPVAHPSNDRGYVVSPFPPHHMIDVRGIPSGGKVVDPSCNRVFINP